MARPARASVVGAAEERSRVVSATSHVCSVLRRESWVCANVGGESLAGGGDMFGRLMGRERKRGVGGVGEFENGLIVLDSISEVWYAG